MLLSRFLVMIFIMALAFSKAESKYLHPRFRGMIIDKSFDEASGEIIFCALFTTENGALNSDKFPFQIVVRDI